MDPNDLWTDFIKTGRIEYYLEYKNSQDFEENKNADNNRCNSNQGK